MTALPPLNKTNTLYLSMHVLATRLADYEREPSQSGYHGKLIDNSIKIIRKKMGKVTPMTPLYKTEANQLIQHVLARVCAKDSRAKENLEMGRLSREQRKKDRRRKRAQERIQKARAAKEEEEEQKRLRQEEAALLLERMISMNESTMIKDGESTKVGEQEWRDTMLIDDPLSEDDEYESDPISSEDDCDDQDEHNESACNDNKGKSDDDCMITMVIDNQQSKDANINEQVKLADDGDDCVITMVIDKQAEKAHRILVESCMASKDELLWYDMAYDFDADMLP